MNGKNGGGDVADGASTDVRRDFAVRDRHHRHRCGCRQPEGLVVSTGIVADVVEITENERHGIESLQTRSRITLKSIRFENVDIDLGNE